MDTPTILFGPWVGEFGYELSYWIGECRAIRKRYPNHKAIASSYKGRGRLYADFTDEFLPHQNSTNETVSMTSGSGIIPHDNIKAYYTMPNFINITPGQTFENLSLGGAHSHKQIQESVQFQEPKILTASAEALQKVENLSKGKPIISILCRIMFRENGTNMWYEENWKELIEKLQREDFCVVLFLPNYSNKPSFLDNTNMDVINIGRLFGESESLTDMQIAFMTKSLCSVATVTGAVMYGYLIGTPFIYMLSSENSEYKKLYDTWKSRYDSKIEYLFGQGDVKDISVDKCFKSLKNLIRKSE